ncbi:hypothetical protein GCM10020331_037170 [Ectobacillus funiculus]
MLRNLLSEPSNFLATIQIGITLAGFMASAFAAGSFAEQLSALLVEIGIPLPKKYSRNNICYHHHLVSLLFYIGVRRTSTKAFGHAKKAELISMLAVIPLTILSKISAPFVKITNILHEPNRPLFFGVDPNAEPEKKSPKRKFA